MLAADWVFWPVVAFMVGCNLFYWFRITADRIAMQWGVDGEVTWSAPKAICMWGMVGFAVTVRALIWAAVTYVPYNVNGPNIGLLLFSLIVAASHFWILRKAAQVGTGL